jgi:CarD family transcriptional regulator
VGGRQLGPVAAPRFLTSHRVVTSNYSEATKEPLTWAFVLRPRGSPWYASSSRSRSRPRNRSKGAPLSAFRKGDTVVHPEHGAAVIQELKDKEFLGEKRKYLVLRVVYGDLTLSVPVDSAEQVGLRPVISKAQVKKLLKVLTESETISAANWSRRFKNNLEKLHSGDPFEVAEVLRNLSIRDREKGLSAGEKRMIQKARQILISELSHATGKTEEDAGLMIDEVLDGAHGVKMAAEA